MLVLGHLDPILRVPSTPYKALQLPQAFFPCLEKQTRISTNKHGDRQALILVLYRFSMFLLLRPRIVDATAKLVSIRYCHSTGAWVVYPGAPPAHTLMALFHAVVPGEAICPAGCIWLALMYMHEMLKENAKKRRTRVKRLSTTPCSEPQVAEELKTYYVSHNS